MENKSLMKSLILGLSTLLGLTLLGVFIYKGLKTFSDKDRVVTVKGLAEMDITATAANIVVDFSFSGDDLQELIKQSDTKKDAIMEYLSTHGYDKNRISVNKLDINDKQHYFESEWQNGQQIKIKVDRYSTTQQLVITASDVKTTEDDAAQLKLDLVSSDLTATIKTSYTFPELNANKPKLIAESTKNARIAGEQFANDSKATLGKIKTASQGQIVIAGSYHYDEEGAGDNNQAVAPYIQKVRVVSTIVFFLE